MNKNTLAVLVLVLAAPAGAQEYRQQQAQAAEEAYKALQAQTASFRNSEAAQVGPRVLDVTLTAMNDGPEASGRVMRLLEEKKIDVYLASQAEPVKRGVVNGRAAILISDALPPRPRVYAPLIASEAAKLMFEDMPACGERTYMRMATAARVYAEMGGGFKTLPKIDGDDVPAVASLVSPWAASPEASVTLESENARFAAFLMDERDARREALRR